MVGNWDTRAFHGIACRRRPANLLLAHPCSTQVSLLSTPSAGYIATFHARMDYEEKSLRHNTATMDFAWAPSSSLGLAATTMGSLGAFGYSSPEG